MKYILLTNNTPFYSKSISLATTKIRVCIRFFEK